MNNEFDEEVILNTQEETTTTPQEEVETDENSEEGVDELRARLAKAEELANNYKIRAEKAERKPEKVETTKVAPKKSSDLSTLDIIAITKADIEPEDVDEVVRYAKFENISISEALKTPVVQTILSQKKEMRQTALATSTGSTRRGSSQISDNQLLANAAKGILPDSDADIDRLAQLKVFRKR